MRETTLDQFVEDPRAFMEAAQQGRLLITRHGKPVAVVIGIEHKDAEDLCLEASPDFWRMIDERRQRPTVPLKDVEAELFADAPSEPTDPGTSQSGGKEHNDAGNTLVPIVQNSLRRGPASRVTPGPGRPDRR